MSFKYFATSRNRHSRPLIRTAELSAILLIVYKSTSPSRSQTFAICVLCPLALVWGLKIFISRLFTIGPNSIRKLVCYYYRCQSLMNQLFYAKIPKLPVGNDCFRPSMSSDSVIPNGRFDRRSEVTFIVSNCLREKFPKFVLKNWADKTFVFCWMLLCCFLVPFIWGN